MAEPFLGEIRMFGFSFNPRGWAFCDGQLLPIAQNSALFSLLGTTYGGDGRVTFALPDLRSRSPIKFGQGAGLDNNPIGSRGGNLNITTGQMPQHSHSYQIDCNSDAASSDDPTGHVPAIAPEDQYAATKDAKMETMTTAVAGSGQPFRNPFLAINFCIAVVGLFPSRS